MQNVQIATLIYYIITFKQHVEIYLKWIFFGETPLIYQTGVIDVLDKIFKILIFSYFRHTKKKCDKNKLKNIHGTLKIKNPRNLFF